LYDNIVKHVKSISREIMILYFVISRIAPRLTFFISEKADTTNYWWIKKTIGFQKNTIPQT